jgi:hypothetical protein
MGFDKFSHLIYRTGRRVIGFRLKFEVGVAVAGAADEESAIGIVVNEELWRPGDVGSKPNWNMRSRRTR